MSSQVILYDLPSKPPCKCWSLNPWKTRMVLNYKKIDYKTQWVEYPDLLPTFKALGLPPNDPTVNSKDYSSPAIKYDDGSFEMDSWKIVHSLEKRYPSPSLHLEDPLVVEIRDLVLKAAAPLRPATLPLVPRNLLNKVSADYFELTREEDFKMSLTQVEEKNPPEECWSKARPMIEELASILTKNEGPYFLGHTVSYADFIFVSYMHFLKRIDERIFERYIDMDPSFQSLYQASQQWLAMDE